MRQILIISAGLGILFIVSILTMKLFTRKDRKNSAGPQLPHSGINLLDEKQKSDIILNAIEDGVFLVDEQKMIQLFNPAAGTVSGWVPTEAIGLDHHAIFTFVNEKNEKLSDAENPISRVFDDQITVREHTITMAIPASDNKVIDISVSPLFDSQSKLRGVVGVFRDVSQLHQEEVQRAEFISTASHEMRTPLAAIEGYLALALNENVSTIDTKAREFLEKAHDSAEHLGQLFQDLLTSAKAEDGRLSNHPVVTDMGDFMTRLVEDFKFSAQKKGLATEFVLGAPENGIVDASSSNVMKPLYFTNVDPERIREVLTNLLDNAIKYTDQGKIVIGLSGDNSVVQIRISDSGSGIPIQDIPHLFQKFYRVDNSATRTIGGTGLGLFICRKIIELYDGRIWVESSTGKGSTFYINLPRLSSDKAQALQRQQASQLVII